MELHGVVHQETKILNLRNCMGLCIFAFLLVLYIRQTEQLLYKINTSNYGRYRLSAYTHGNGSKRIKIATCRTKHKQKRDDTKPCVLRNDTQFLGCLRQNVLKKCVLRLILITYFIWPERAQSELSS